MIAQPTLSKSDHNAIVIMANNNNNLLIPTHYRLMQIPPSLSSLNTAHSCSQHGPAIAWLTSERPETLSFSKKNLLCWEYCAYHNVMLGRSSKGKIDIPASYATMFLERRENGWSYVRCASLLTRLLLQNVNCPEKYDNL